MSGVLQTNPPKITLIPRIAYTSRPKYTVDVSSNKWRAQTICASKMRQVDYLSRAVDGGDDPGVAHLEQRRPEQTNANTFR
jgi:hypothetical protein